MRVSSLKFSSRWKFVIALFMLASIAIYAFVRTDQIKEHLDNTVVSNNTKAAILLDMRVGAMKRIRDLGKLSRLTDAKEMQVQSEVIKNSANEYFETEARLNKIVGGSASSLPEEQAMMRKVQDTGAAAAPVVARIQELALTSQATELNRVVSEELDRGPVKIWLDAVNDMIAFENDLTAKAAIDASIAYSKLRTQVLMICAVIVLLGMVSAWLTITRISSESMVAEA